MIENPGVNLALLVAPGGFADKFGQEVVAAELTRGFTVLRQGDGGEALGLLLGRGVVLLVLGLICGRLVLGPAAGMLVAVLPESEAKSQAHVPYSRTRW